jgi:hypothetical protein
MSQVNLFKIQEDEIDAFNNFIESKYELISDSLVGSFHFKLFWQESQGKTNVNWGWAFTIFDTQIKQTQKAPKGIIVIQNSDTTDKVYAISFGGAHFHIDPYCDRDFGFNFASRVKVQQTKLTSTINSYSKQNKSIHSFKNYAQLDINSGESYTKLKLDVDLAEETIFANNVIEVGTSIKMTIKDDSLANLTKFIKFVEETINGPKITKIPVFFMVMPPFPDLYVSTSRGHAQAEARTGRCQVVVGKSRWGQNGLRALKSGVTLFCRAGKDTALSGSARLTVLGRKCFSAVFRKLDAGG